jgi:hypothetical protein
VTFSHVFYLPSQHLLPAFEKEGVTDDVVRALALVDLKALGLPTMAAAVQFKTCVSELLLAAEGRAIEKPPHAAAESAAAAAAAASPAAAAAAEPSAPPLELVASAQQSHHEGWNVPPEFTDQCAMYHTRSNIQLTAPQLGTSQWSCCRTRSSQPTASRTPLYTTPKHPYYTKTPLLPSLRYCFSIVS